MRNEQRGNGGVYVSGNFSKTGGIIYGYDSSDNVNSNVVKNSRPANYSDNGHAVYGSPTAAE